MEDRDTTKKVTLSPGLPDEPPIKTTRFLCRTEALWPVGIGTAEALLLPTLGAGSSGLPWVHGFPTLVGLELGSCRGHHQ